MQHLPVHPFLVHPRTGAPLVALGYRRNGDPIWPIMGGDGTDDDANDDGADSDGGDDQGDSDDKLAPEDDPDSIEYWKKRSRQNERDAKRAKRERDAALNGKADDKSGDDEKVDADEIRKQAKAEASAELLKGRVEDKIEAKARAFADPEDAVAVLLRLHDIEDFIDGDKIDVEAIAAALEELGAKKPHLLAQGKRFKGSADGGARKDSGKSIDDQIAEATKAGNHRLAISLKRQKAYANKT